jgi:actin-like ATPase involved in cell morphogenesis
LRSKKMAEEKITTESVTQTSSGTVKITVEEYNDLMRRAHEPKTTVNPVYKTIEKTPEMQASDLVHMGAFFMGGGGALFVLGAVQFVVGRGKLKALKA